MSLLTSPEERVIFNHCHQLKRNRRTDTYTPCAALIGMKPNDPRFWKILGNVSQESYRLWGILLSATIVGYERNYPGQEFFPLAKSLGFRFKNPVDFWVKHLGVVFNTDTDTTQ